MRDPSHACHTSWHCFVQCPKGIAPLLAQEIQQLGIDDAKQLPTGVSFHAPLVAIYRVLFYSRLASRVLLGLTTVNGVEDAEQLYAKLRHWPWHEHLQSHLTLAVAFYSHSRQLNNEALLTLKVKDAIVDQLLASTGKRPNIDRQEANYRVVCHAHRDQVTVYLDLAGFSLHKRGYRDVNQAGAKATLKENVAAALLQRSGWPQSVQQGQAVPLLMDPFCGSGTLLLEGIARYYAIPAQWQSWPNFALWHWLGHDELAWEKVQQAAQETMKQTQQWPLHVWGSDVHGSMITLLRQSLDNLLNSLPNGLPRLTVLSQTQGIETLSDTKKNQTLLNWAQHSTCLLCISNPPYGVRLNEQSDYHPLYQSLGKVWQALQGLRPQDPSVHWQGAVYIGEVAESKQAQSLAQAIPYRYDKKVAIANGNLDAFLYLFDVTHQVYAPRMDLSRWNLAEQWLNAEPALAHNDLGQPLANRIRKNQRKLKSWLKQEQVTAYRIYDADLPEFALAVDVYHLAIQPKGKTKPYAVVQEYRAPKTIDEVQAKQRLKHGLCVLPGALNVAPNALIYKQRKNQKGRNQYQKLHEQQLQGWVQEGGLWFKVNLTDYLDTGLFLDHRWTRGYLTRWIEQRKHTQKTVSCLNLFCYTGSVSTYAASAGAKVTSVDLSSTYLAWAESHFKANGLLQGDGAKQHHFVKADVLQWLRDKSGHSASGTRLGLKYDLIFLDPPTFSTSKAMEETLDVQRDHVHLVNRCMSLLKNDGLLLFSNNFRKFKLDSTVTNTYQVTDLTQASIPPDYQQKANCHVLYQIEHGG